MNETVTTELVPSCEKRDAAGRRIMDPARRVQLLAAYEKSGLTQAAFARREGLNAQTFSTWVQPRASEPFTTAGSLPRSTLWRLSVPRHPQCGQPRCLSEKARRLTPPHLPRNEPLSKP